MIRLRMHRPMCQKQAYSLVLEVIDTDFHSTFKSAYNGAAKSNPVTPCSLHSYNFSIMYLFKIHCLNL
jgi:hypothetical protein